MANLSPQDVVKSLQKLNDEKTRELVFHLGVDTCVLDDTETRSNPRIHAIQAWLDRDTEASWKKIVSVLKQIGMNVLAKEVALQHCPQLSESAPPKSVLTSPPVSTPAPTAHATPSSATAAVVKSEQSPTQSTDLTEPLAVTIWSVAKVKATILQLEEKFLDLISDAEDEINEKENQDRRFLKKFRNYLLLLPIARKATHVKFFKESESDFLEAKNTQKILAILCRHWNYRNYDILLHLIDRFCDAPLQQNMQGYCTMLEGFEMATTVDVYISAIPPDTKLQVAFSKMVVKINKPSSECTLHEIRKLNEAIIEGSSLSSHSVYISSVTTNCVVVMLQFPSSAVGWVLAGMTTNFMCKHLLTEVTVDGKHLTVVQETMEVLNDQLFDASRSGDVVRVASLLNSGADVETENYYSGTPLVEASWKSHLHTVRLLLQRGAKVDSRDGFGYTPLIAAAWKGRCDVVIELLHNGADIEAQDNGGRSALMKATYKGKTEVVVELVKAGANLDLQNNGGGSALMRAAYWGKTEVVVELVKAGANLDLQNTDGNSALMRAAGNGATEVVVELVKAGANLNLQNNDGNSALMQAAYNGRTEIVVELVKAGANLDLQNTKGDSAVIRATVRHASGALRELVRAGADLNLQNEEGLTALMISARSGRTKLTDILLTGENIDTDIQENSTGWSALFFSAERGDVATTTSLLGAGANTNLKDKNGLTALEVAAASADKEYEVRDFDRVCELLTQHIQESATLHETSATVQDSTPTHQDSSTAIQDKPLSDQDSTDNLQVMPTPQRRRRRVSQALRNLVNWSGQRAQVIFNTLQKRLKSTDKNTELGVRGEGRRLQKTKTTGNRPPDNETSSTTNTVPVK